MTRAKFLLPMVGLAIVLSLSLTAEAFVAYHGYHGSAAWGGGSGAYHGAYGGAASWSHGSGSATGGHGGSASWGGGSGSYHGAYGGSGSWSR